MKMRSGVGRKFSTEITSNVSKIKIGYSSMEAREITAEELGFVDETLFGYFSRHNPDVISLQSIGSHTILFVQPNTRPDTRTYSDYESLNECLEGICKIYEEHLKRQNPDCPSITYDISQLFDFIDQLNDVSCLVFQKNLGTYVPHNKDWLKEKIYIMLRKQAGR